MLSFNRQFWKNPDFILFVVACVVLGLSIWALVAKCPENFGSNCSIQQKTEGDIIGTEQSLNYAGCALNTELAKRTCAERYDEGPCELIDSPDDMNCQNYDSKYTQFCSAN
jgi:hypothetical protein